MKPLTKKILITSGIAVTGFLLFGFRKAKNLLEIFDSLKFDIVPGSLKMQNLSFDKFQLALRLQNKTNIDFGIAVNSLIKITGLRAYKLDRTQIGTANFLIDAIQIPANGYYDTPLINIHITKKSALADVGLQHLANGIPLLELIIIEIDYEVFSRSFTHTINAKDS